MRKSGDGLTPFSTHALSTPRPPLQGSLCPVRLRIRLQARHRSNAACIFPTNAHTGCPVRSTESVLRHFRSPRTEYSMQRCGSTVPTRLQDGRNPGRATSDMELWAPTLPQGTKTLMRWQENRAHTSTYSYDYQRHPFPVALHTYGAQSTECVRSAHAPAPACLTRDTMTDRNWSIPPKTRFLGGQGGKGCETLQVPSAGLSSSSSSSSPQSTSSTRTS